MIRAILLCLALASPALADTATVRNDGLDLLTPEAHAGLADARA